jgi:hypothetical protein
MSFQSLNEFYKEQKIRVSKRGDFSNDQFEVRDFRNGDWYWCSKFILQDKRLTASDKVVYSVLASFVNNRQKCFPSTSKVASLAGITKRTVISSIKKLKNYKYIEVNAKKGKVSIYYLLKVKEVK